MIARLALSISLLAVSVAHAQQPAVTSPTPEETPDETPEATPVATPEVTPESTPAATDEETPAAAGEPAPAETPRDVGAELDALRTEVERLRDIVEPEGAVGDGAVSRGTGLMPVDLAVRAPGNVRLGGVTTGAAVFAEEEDRAQLVLPRTALFAHAPVGDRVAFSGEAVFLGGGAELLDADRGLPGRGDAFLQLALVDLTLVPEKLVLRGGLVPVPVGRVNLRSDESVEELVLRPAEALWVIPAPWTDAGAGIVGSAFLGRTRVEWQGYVLAGPSSGIDARTGFRGSRQLPGSDRNDDKAVAARVMVEPVEGVELAVSGYTGAYSQDGRRRASLGAFDAGIDLGALLFEAEAVYARTDGGAGALGFPVPRELAGASAQLTYRFFPDVLGAVLPDSLQSASFGATVRASFADTDLTDDDAASEDETDPEVFSRRDRLGVGLSFRPVPRCVLRAEWEFRTEAGAEVVDDDRAVLSASAAF